MTLPNNSSQGLPPDVDSLLAIKDLPVVLISQEGLFTYVNQAFTDSYGWTEDDLLNKQVTLIMPPHMRGAHKIGFARFLATEEATLLGTNLPLKVQRKDGSVLDADHYILGDKVNGEWRFASIIKAEETAR